MQLSELKLIFASNIINLRTAAGMTQSELGAKINYSDKTVSKWERGEAIPDAFVLTQLAGLFHVTVDYLLSSHDSWEAPAEEAEEHDPKYTSNIIIAICILGVWTAALSAFVALWLFDIIWWETFLIAVPVSLVLYIVLICVFGQKRYLQFAIAALVLSLFGCLYVFLPNANPWQLFLIAVPAEALVFLSCNTRRNPLKRLKKRTNK